MSIGTENFFGCAKDGNKVRDFPTITAREKEGKQVTQVFRVMML